MSRIFAWLVVAMLSVALAEVLTVGYALEVGVRRQGPVGGAGKETIQAGIQPLPWLVDRKAGSSVAVDITTNGWMLTGVLSIHARDGDLWLTPPSQYDQRRLGPNQKDCTGNEGSWSCKVVLRTSRLDTETWQLYPIGSSSYLQNVVFTKASAHRASGATVSAVFLLVGVLLAIAPLLVALARRSEISEQIVTALIGAMWVLLIGWAGFAIVSIFLFAGYAAVLLVGRRKDMVSAVAWFAVLIALALFFVKVVIPAAGGAFSNPGGFSLALPLGLSYMAIRLLDLLFSVRATVIRLGPVAYLGFMLNPAMLPAGPIMTFSDFQKSRIQNWSVVDYAAGIARCGVGVAKKLVADAWVYSDLASRYDVFLLNPEGATISIVAPMLLLNLAFIALDFSAYADLAIGCGRAMGRRLPENFDWPLFRTSLRLYWQHWHMTLSNWVMRRVYFPVFLESRSIAVSAFSSMLIIGLWHQPNMAWALWAAHHALGLTINSYYISRTQSSSAAAAQCTAWKQLLERCRAIAGWLIMLLWVAIGYVYTLFDNLALSAAALKALLQFKTSGL